MVKYRLQAPGLAEHGRVTTDSGTSCRGSRKFYPRRSERLRIRFDHLVRPWRFGLGSRSHLPRPDTYAGCSAECGSARSHLRFHSQCCEPLPELAVRDMVLPRKQCTVSFDLQRHHKTPAVFPFLAFTVTITKTTLPYATGMNDVSVSIYRGRGRFPRSDSFLLFSAYPLHSEKKKITYGSPQQTINL